MRGVPKFPVLCSVCGELNGAPKDKLCHACRLRSRPNSRKRFFWTKEFDGRLRDSYTRASTRSELTASLDALQRLTGFPRFVILARAADLGLSFLRRRPWSDEELHFLKSNAGRLSMKALAARLSRSYYSVKAAIRSTELDGRVTDGYSVDELARTFGVGKATIHRWIVRGWITRNEGRITETSVLRFLRFRPHEYQLRRVDEVWFKALVFAPRHSAR
jgi:hypothetical protein